MWRLEFIARRYPITIFQIAVFALHYKTWQSFLLLFAALLLDRHLTRLATVDHYLAETWKVARFVKRHARCSYERIALASVVTSDVLKRYRSQLMTDQGVRREDWLRKVLGWRPFDDHMLQQTRIYVVQRGDADERPCPTAFRVDLGGYIFLTEGPKHIVGVQRFFLLHELGHLSPRATYTVQRSRVGGSKFFILELWVIPQLVDPHISTWGMAIAGVLILINRLSRDFFWSAVRMAGDALNEVHADRFALENLPERELVTVAKFYQRWPIPRDESLEPMMDEARRGALNENLRMVLETKRKHRQWVGYQQPTKTELPVFICGALSAAIVPFTYPAGPLAISFAAFMCFGVMGLTWYYHWRGHTLNRWIEDLLSRDIGARDQPASWPTEPWWQTKLRTGLGYQTDMKWPQLTAGQ